MLWRSPPSMRWCFCRPRRSEPVSTGSVIPSPPAQGIGARGSFRADHPDSIVKQPTLRRPVSRRAPDAPCLFFRSPKNEGKQSADRRWCGYAAPGGPSRERTDLRIAGDHRPMTRAGAPLGALRRRSPYGGGPRFRRRRACAHRSSASSWQEAIVPPGGAPPPPGCRLRAGSAGAAPARGPELPGAGCRI